MATAKITLQGMQNYAKAENKSIFDSFTLPEGIDTETVKESIMFEAGDFGIVYADLDYMIEAVGMWCKKWKYTFEKWNKAISIEYEPLENYRRKEHWDDTGSNTDKSKTTGSNSGNSTTTGNNQNDYKVTTYENDTLHQKDRTNDSGTSTTNASGTFEDKRDASGTYANKRDGLAYGNIGVTTSQQMLEAELEVARWNLIEQITDMFIRDFCILVYV